MPVPTNMPSHAKEIFEKIMTTLKGKTNPRTGKPYTDEDRAQIAWSAVKKKYKKVGESWEAKEIEEFDFEPIFSELMEFKAENGNYYFKGYLSTFDVDLVNDLVTPECMKDMLNQINAGLGGFVRGMKGSPDHDVYWTGDTAKVPISKLTSGRLDAKGLFVEGMFNADHPDFKGFWSQVQNGFYDGLSIEYKPEDFTFKDMNGKKIRVLNKILLKGYGHTPRPANPHSTLTDCFVKSLEIKDAEEMEMEGGMVGKVRKHLSHDIEEHQKMMDDDHKFLKELGDEKKQEDDIDDEEENESAKAEIKSEVKIMEEKTEIKAEPQPTPKTEIKQEKPETVEEKKAEVKAVDLKALTEEIKAIVKEELKNLIPEKKDLPNTEDKFVTEIKSLDLIGYVAKQLGVK